MKVKSLFTFHFLIKYFRMITLSYLKDGGGGEIILKNGVGAYVVEGGAIKK